MKLCQCGCGQPVRLEHHRFIYNHHTKGKTKETDENVRRRARTLKQKYASGEIVAWNDGLTKETNKSLCIQGEEISKTVTGRTKETHDGFLLISKKAKIRWQNIEFREKQLRAMLNGRFKRPTSYEQRIIDLVSKHNLQYKYVGDGAKYIHGRYPDFISTKGIKALIEVYHSYFKIQNYGSSNEYEKLTREHYAKYGYKTIFLSETDLFKPDWEEHCLNKIEVV